MRRTDLSAVHSFPFYNLVRCLCALLHNSGPESTRFSDIPEGRKRAEEKQ